MCRFIYFYKYFKQLHQRYFGIVKLSITACGIKPRFRGPFTCIDVVTHNVRSVPLDRNYLASNTKCRPRVVIHLTGSLEDKEVFADIIVNLARVKEASNDVETVPDH